MATTTTNYGFDVPTSSDLVKNGATQIALLGQDLDTFLFRPFTRNGALNSGMNVWQRGTSFTATAGYTADRWYVNHAVAGRTVSRQVTNDTTNLPFIQYALRYQRDSGNTNTANNSILYQSFESVNSIPFAGKTVTMSFYARAGANYSAASGRLGVYLISGTGTDQNYGVGYTGAAFPINNQTATLTTTWQRFTFSGTVAATATELTTYFESTPVGTAGANDWFEVTGVQLEVGNQASPYAPATPTYATELAACQRYYWRSVGGAAYSVFGGNCSAWSSTDLLGGFNLPVTMRTNPTSVEFSTLIASDGVNNNSVGTLTFSAAYSSPNVGGFSATSTSLTAFRFYRIQANNSTSAYIAYSAEL
jgi:hypothetical protein